MFYFTFYFGVIIEYREEDWIVKLCTSNVLENVDSIYERSSKYLHKINIFRKIAQQVARE